MAKPCTTCSCIPYVNRCSSPPQNDISVFMPQCHMVPGQTTAVNNPCFDGTVSYWTYRLFVQCPAADNPVTVSYVAIPLCSQITADRLKVFERIEGCMNPEERPFELISSNNPNAELGTAPEGFLYLKINNDYRYEQGVSVEYSLQIAGNYPETLQHMLVKADNQEALRFCEGSFIVPGCPKPAELEITETNETIINENDLTMKYFVEIRNKGDLPAENVEYLGVFGFDSVNMSIEKVTVSSEQEADFQIETLSSLIQKSGKLGSIPPEGTVKITETHEIRKFNQPGNYAFLNIVKASMKDKSCQAASGNSVQALRVSAGTSCFIKDSNHLVFKITAESNGASPQTVVFITDELTIPEGLSVKLTALEGCTASVPLNEVITGEATIYVTGADIEVPASGIGERNIELEVLTAELLGAPFIIRNRILDLKPLCGSCQLVLGVYNVPIECQAAVIVRLE